MSYEGFKLVRLTAKIFQPGEFEKEQYAQAGLPPLVEVDDWEPEAIAPKVADADIVIVVGTPMPKKVNALPVTLRLATSSPISVIVPP